MLKFLLLNAKCSGVSLSLFFTFGSIFASSNKSLDISSANYRDNFLTASETKDMETKKYV